jgi:hypothetical protein
MNHVRREARRAVGIEEAEDEGPLRVAGLGRAGVQRRGKKGIARTLSLRVPAVKSHQGEIFSILEVTSCTEAMLYGLRGRRLEPQGEFGGPSS